MTISQHFVTFYSPGTFTAEETTKPIESWDVDTAVKMAAGIKERHAAVPYGFRFSTRSREDGELDSKVSSKSNMYYLGGKVETIEDVERRNDPKESVLLSNMRCNGYDRIVVNTNSWKWTQPLRDDDVILNVDLCAEL